MTEALDIAIALFLVISGIFGFVGSFGLIKLRDPMSRLHAPTKSTTLGVGGVLVASMLHAVVFEGRVSMHELLIALFLFITAPITANFIAKVHLHFIVDDRDLPEPDIDETWAVRDVPDPDSDKEKDPA
ncbi:MAG: Na+/H+ antiporter subunit G [Marinibacterium sp.]